MDDRRHPPSPHHPSFRPGSKVAPVMVEVRRNAGVAMLAPDASRCPPHRVDTATRTAIEKVQLALRRPNSNCRKPSAGASHFRVTRPDRGRTIAMSRQ